MAEKPEPAVARPFPMHVHVEQGKKYNWCSCGMSMKQPFCDGRHKGTDFRPVSWTAPSTGKVLFCMCKTTKNQPLCDMSHIQVIRRMYGTKIALLAGGGVFAGGIVYALTKNDEELGKLHRALAGGGLQGPSPEDTKELIAVVHREIQERKISHVLTSAAVAPPRKCVNGDEQNSAEAVELKKESTASAKAPTPPLDDEGAETEDYTTPAVHGERAPTAKSDSGQTLTDQHGAYDSLDVASAASGETHFPDQEQLFKEWKPTATQTAPPLRRGLWDGSDDSDASDSTDSEVGAALREQKNKRRKKSKRTAPPLMRVSSYSGAAISFRKADAGRRKKKSKPQAGKEDEKKLPSASRSAPEPSRQVQRKEKVETGVTSAPARAPVPRHTASHAPPQRPTPGRSSSALAMCGPTAGKKGMIDMIRKGRSATPTPTATSSFQQQSSPPPREINGAADPKPATKEAFVGGTSSPETPAQPPIASSRSNEGETQQPESESNSTQGLAPNEVREVEKDDHLAPQVESEEIPSLQPEEEAPDRTPNSERTPPTISDTPTAEAIGLHSGGSAEGHSEVEITGSAATVGNCVETGGDHAHHVGHGSLSSSEGDLEAPSIQRGTEDDKLPSPPPHPPSATIVQARKEPVLIISTQPNPALQSKVGQPTPVPVAQYSDLFQDLDSLFLDPHTMTPLSHAGPEKGTGKARGPAQVRQKLQEFISWLEGSKPSKPTGPTHRKASMSTPPLAHKANRDSRWGGRTFKVQRSRTEVYDLLCSVLEPLDDDDDEDEDDEEDDEEEMDESSAEKWREVRSENDFWHLWWSWRKPRPKEPLWVLTQKVNHIPGSGNVSRKDLLKANIQRFANGGGAGASFFRIVPDSFILPTEYVAFAKRFAAEREKRKQQQGSSSATDAAGLWIMKPVGMSRGRGVQIVKDIEDVVYTDVCVIQRYVDHPLLMDQRKFDFRLYVLVTSFSPLECFLSRLGFARLATKTYQLDQFDDKSIHLTNTAIAVSKSTADKSKAGRRTSSHRLNEADSSEDDSDTPAVETKWPLPKVQKYFERVYSIHHTAGRGPSGTPYPGWTELWRQISQTVVTALSCGEEKIPSTLIPTPGQKRASEGDQKAEGGPGSGNGSPGSLLPPTFELFGFDVLIDRDFRPWLLEVNASPSMEIYGEIDQWMKPQLIQDIVSLLDPIPVDVGALKEVTKEWLAEPHRGHNPSKEKTTKGQDQLAEGLHRILRGKTPRRYGEMPQHLGEFERLAPGELYDVVLKAKKRAF